MASRDFVHLHTHSHYSLLEALPKIPELVAAAKKDGQKALALTDNGNLYGAIEFYKECTAQELKPIIGVDFFLAPRTRHDKEHGTDEPLGRLVLLAKNTEGYHNLLKLVSLSYLEGFYIRPRIDRDLLQAYSEGLVAILPSHAGEVAYALRHGAADKASQIWEWYYKLFGKDCYLELTRHPEIADYEERVQELASFASKHNAPLVAAHDVYYLSREDGLACDLVNKIRTASVLEREGGEYRMKDFSFQSRARMKELFADLPEALENAARIASECTLELQLGKAIFPSFPIPEGSTDDAELKKLVEVGLKERSYKATKEIQDRIEYELDIIKQKGYASYFLIVADLLRWAREEGILTNTRGSAAGSLVSYLCGITTVDPVVFNMPFERFLNPERPSAPDIDMDIADNRRDALIEYAREKYGDDHVVQIGTFGTMMARAAVRDVARALGHPYALGDAIAKLIPFGKQGFPVTIESAMKETQELRQLAETDQEAGEVLELARKLEGNSRHVGVHAAGVVISPKPVVEYTPIQPDPKGGKKITQYDMYSIADEYGGVGLLKFDFLGLTNLSVLADSVARVRERLDVEVDLDRLDLDDKKTYDMLSRGETLGVFQMAGSGMTAYLKELQPSVIHDLNAMVALYRPGPMAFIPQYIERKKNPSKVTYPDPRLEEILKPTYGVLIYQDDVMLMAVKLAGYSWGEADKFRKAMGKKIPEEMAAQKDKFLKGCVEGGMKPQVAQKLWEQIETFAAYGFNKAHAASYGNLAYKTAYMKANFPVDYMASVLTAENGDVDKIAETVAECKRMGLTVLPPSVDESKGTFTVVDDSTIRFGLYSIKNFGSGVGDAIIAAREDGPFTDIADFLSRVSDKNLNKKSLESLIECGAMDNLGERGALLANIEHLLGFHREHQKKDTAQASLFGALPQQKATLRLEGAESASMEQRLTWEKELLGLYVSGHPLDKHKEKMARQKMDIATHKEKFPKGLETVIAGYVESTQPIITKNGERMLFAKLSDYSGGVELVAFPRVVQQDGTLIAPGACIMVKGKFSERNGETSFIVERAKAL